MELELYIALRDQIKNKLGDRIKTVARFNNQFVRSNETGDENAFLYPAVFIQFTPSQITNLANGVVQRELIVTTHLGFESYNTDDVEILQLKQDLFKVVHYFQQGNYDKLSLVDERISYDFDNIEVLESDYRTSGNDFTADKRALTSFAVTPIFSATTIQLSGLTQ